MSRMTLDRFLRKATPAIPLIVGPALAEEDRAFWPQANKHVLWGWKRDAGKQSRIVYYSGFLRNECRGIAVENSFFFYKHRTSTEIAEGIACSLAASSRSLLKSVLGESSLWKYPSGDGFSTVLFKIGMPQDEDIDRVIRLIKRRPRKQIQQAVFPPEAHPSQALELFPADLYAGSGVSYEAGLPTLCEVHDFFCLDNHASMDFTLGSADLLPQWLAENPVRTFMNFCHLHVQVLSAKPTPAQKTIAALCEKGMVRKVFSDNVDNLMCKVQVPFERTRGSGVFNERFPASFESKTLLVVGVAADRRQLIQQARGRNMRIVVVDPCGKVSHGVQHLNYIKKDDTFCHMTAHQFFSEICKLVGD
jgi:hypothetical protein